MLCSCSNGWRAFALQLFRCQRTGSSCLSVLCMSLSSVLSPDGGAGAGAAAMQASRSPARAVKRGLCSAGTRGSLFSVRLLHFVGLPLRLSWIFHCHLLIFHCLHYRSLNFTAFTTSLMSVWPRSIPPARHRHAAITLAAGDAQRMETGLATSVDTPASHKQASRTSIHTNRECGRGFARRDRERVNQLKQCGGAAGPKRRSTLPAPPARRLFSRNGTESP